MLEQENRETNKRKIGRWFATTVHEGDNDTRSAMHPLLVRKQERKAPGNWEMIAHRILQEQKRKPSKQTENVTNTAGQVKSFGKINMITQHSIYCEKITTSRKTASSFQHKSQPRQGIIFLNSYYPPRYYFKKKTLSTNLRCGSKELTEKKKQTRGEILPVPR